MSFDIATIFILVFYTGILILILYWFLSSIITIIKNRKNLKNLFQISKKHKVRDIFQIIIHSAIYIFILLLFILIWNEANRPCYQNNRNRYVKKSISILNQAISLEYEIEKTKISDLETSNDLKALFGRRLNILEKTNLHKKYQDERYFQTADGIIYSIVKFEKGCKTIDIENPMNSSCVMEFDVNGEKKPNKLNDDIFQAVIDAENMRILPSAYITEHIFNQHR